MDLENAGEAINKLRANLHRVIKGHEFSVDLLVIAILAKGHVLLESVPGEGKTLLASALAASTTPLATMSQRMIPPKMLISTARTLRSESSISKA